MAQWKKFLEGCRSLHIHEERSFKERYCELVFYSKDLKAWESFIQDFLGPPAKPAGAEPGEEDFALAEPFGGIRFRQILYRKDLGEAMVIAMFWPWEDGRHITLKMGYILPEDY